MADFRPLIAQKLASGAPKYIRSFQQVKAHVERMIADGDAERVAPPKMRARNMVKLTEKGRKRWLGGPI